MKITFRSFFTLLVIPALLFCALLPFTALAAEGDPTTPGTFDIWLYVIPFVTPLLIAGVKWLVPRIPNPMLPVLAPMLGVALEAINSALTTSEFDPAAAAGLGLMGVGIRELIDQLMKAKDGISDNPAGSAAYVEQQKKAAGSSSSG